ncbi:MAG TPA: UDP-3-O-(3-hydroxymyristoyl)glucosamine N-acyltransferase [Candidatus Aquilonibacter sp.]|nr:UDP-3-O-(3-hydroxymyristoyl)glucosamine N-acyltransferase [Candidatus Aquilonibacter sp.]
MRRSLREIAVAVGARLHGDGAVVLTGVASIAAAEATDLVFVEDEKHLAAALESPAGAVIAGTFAEGSSTKPLLISDHPKLAFARAAGFLLGSRIREKKTDVSGFAHPTATIHPSVSLAAGVVIEEHAVLREDVRIGDKSQIGAGAVIGTGVSIGRECVIYPNVTIYPGTTVGDRVVVHAGAVLGSDGFGYVRDVKSGRYEKFPQVGRLVIEDDVEIGANTTIDRGALDETRIGRGTKLDNLVHVGHNCRLGENVVIAAQTGISGSVVIEDDVVLGGQVGIGDHVRLEAAVIVGAQGGVPSNKILRGKGVVFWGTPARPIGKYLKQLAELARLSKKETT